MKYSTVEDVMASFPHPVLPTVEGEPDYQIIHATRKFLQASSQVIDTHLGGGTLGHLPHHFRCFLRHDCSSNSRGTNSVGNTKRPRVGTSNNGWNSSPNQRRSSPVGRGCSDLPDLHLRPAGIEEANHQRLRYNVLGHLELKHGGICQRLSKKHVGPPL
jgi:hypothetical protein